MSGHGIHRVLVVGAGTMGAGIAEVAAKAGAITRLYDVSQAQLDRARTGIEGSLARAVEKGKTDPQTAVASLDRIQLVTSLDASAVDLVVEAVPEDIALKKDLLGRVASTASPMAIIASNTSSLSVTELASAVPSPERVLGLHFFNPPPIMPLIEIVTAEQTSAAVLERARAWAESIGKSPIVVRDFPGFATSRLGLAIGLEAIRMLESGVASAQDIDRAMTLGYRHPMGPLELTDLVGLDVRLAIADHLATELGSRFAPPPLLRQLVRAGKLGKKVGEGFYRWVDGRAVPGRW